VYSAIYYGSEIGMAGNKDKGDAAIRQDFPGGWKAIPTMHLQRRTNCKQNEYFDFIAKLFNCKTKQLFILENDALIPENNVYVYFRYNKNETVMVNEQQQ
jgi:glycosidase